MLHAPDFPSHLPWLNTPQPLTLKKLRGHVVVLDFWTYCCINCIHILPDLKELEEFFAGKAVAVIGVHAAKFKNEQSETNIQSAIDRYEIAHPVVVDNDHEIWDSYAVRAWPSFVVIDTEGYVRAQFSGEGQKGALKQAVEQLLKEADQKGTLATEPLSLHTKPTTNSSTLKFPGKICLDDTGKKLFISDSNHNRILVTELSSPTEAHIVATIGSGEEGRADGTFNHSSFNHPQGLAYKNNQLLICDTENHLLRLADLSSNTVATLAGTGHQALYGGEGGIATTTALNSPWDVTLIDESAYIAMAGSHQIWRYDFNTKVIEVFAGNGYENIVDGPRTQAQLAQPSGITHTNHSLYFADSEVSAVRSLDLKTDKVETLVGHHLFVFGDQDGDFEDALLQHPLGLTAEGHEVWVADTYNQAIRKLDLQTKSVSTVIKRTSKDSCTIGDEECMILPLYEPNDIKKQGHYLYIADTNNHLIRVFNLENNSLTDLTFS